MTALAAGRKRALSPREKRAALRARADLMRGTRGAEKRFVAALRGIVKGVHEVFLAYLEPAMREAVTPPTLDAKGAPPHTPKATGRASRDVDTILRAVLPQVGPKVAAAHERMAGEVSKAYAISMSKILPVGWKNVPSTVQAQAGLARDNAITLCEKAVISYADQTREVFADPEQTIGKRWEDLRDALIDRGVVNESRAELIARDQTLKLNAAINQAHQRSVGVDSYVWSTSGDERVRDSHAELDGQTFRWDAPPEPGNPGEDFQCRCVALPIIDDLAGFDMPGQRPDAGED